MISSSEKPMDKQDVPESWGVFKPVGHVLLAFAEGDDQRAAVDALADAGFEGKDVVRYSSAEMVEQSERQIENSGPLASLGQDKNLVKRHHELAQQGYSFLIVFAPEREQTERVAEIAKRCNAELAQKYGQMMIEELI